MVERVIMWLEGTWIIDVLLVIVITVAVMATP